MDSTKAQMSSELKTSEANSLQQFLSYYQKLDRSNLELLEQMYSDQVVFIDPLHQIEGLTALQSYFAKLYENASSLTFDFQKSLTDGSEASVYWTLSFVHPKLNKGQLVTVHGNSRLNFGADGRVYRHQDYFDAGSLLYRQIPGLKQVIKFIDGRLA